MKGKTLDNIFVAESLLRDRKTVVERMSKGWLAGSIRVVVRSLEEEVRVMCTVIYSHLTVLASLFSGTKLVVMQNS